MPTQLIRALLKMLCQRALLKMPSQLIRALLKMKAGVANTSSAQDAVTANTSPAQDAYPANTSSAQYKSWRCFQDDQHEGETGSSSSTMLRRTSATLPSGDSRFLYKRKQRVYVCDGCGCSQSFKKQALPFDGTWKRRTWGDGIEPHELETMYKAGEIDATWWCTRCLAQSEGTTQESVRWSTGIYQVQYRQGRSRG